ncbi:MAG: hypothetical protein GXO80_12345 [Chlorobi bacterium]|nr:hypothetical protein [Chlorobiota bacterium]
MKKLSVFALIVLSVFLSFCSEKQENTVTKNTVKDIVTKKETIIIEKDTAVQKENIAVLNVVDYFRLLKKDKLIDFPYTLSKSGNTWKSTSTDEAGFVNECGTLVDIKNGYIKFEDEGTGAGIFVTEIALFKTSNKRNILAVNTYFADDILQNSSKPPKFYEYKNGNFKLLKDIFPVTTPNQFFIKPYNLKKELLGTYFELPHYGTTIKFCLDMNYAAKQEEKYRQNIKQTEFLYKFDKKQGNFFLK